MKRFDYFIKALNAGAYKRKAWVIKAFSVFLSDGRATLHPVDYDLRYIESVLSFFNPLINDWEAIDDAVVDEPLFKFKEAVTVQAGALPNIKTEVETTYGRLLVNAATLVFAFGNKIDYVNTKPFNVKSIMAIIEPLLTDDVEGDTVQDPKRIYVNELQRFGQAMYQLASYSSLCVPGASPKSLTKSPAALAIKAKMLEEYKDRLNDPAVIARIEAAIVAEDRKWVDDDARDFYIKDKAFTNTRKRQHYMVGLEKGMGAKAGLITNSLADGIDFKNFDAYCNQSRDGSHSRGHETQLGGVVAKEALRTFQNINIGEADCGSTVGFPILVQKEHVKELVGFSMIIDNRSVELTPELITPLIGRKIALRSPMLCKTAHTDLCAVCMGKVNSSNPTGLNALAAGVGSTFLGAFMAKMHNTTLVLRRYRPSISIR